MGKSKDEDKIEKIIRGLLKLPENRRCINCNSLGPQYVCTNFWTFVCTNCCGVHREFTDRVKSVSMAKFSMEEVSALQAGGNGKARQFYFKTWDPQFNSFPDNSNIPGIREFIKHVYVNRHFTGETHPTLVSKSPSVDIYDSSEHRRSGITESSSFHEKNNDRYTRPSSDELRNPRYNSRENSGYDGVRPNSSRSEGTSVGYYQVDDPRDNPKYGAIKEKSSHFDSKGGRCQVDDPRENSKYGGSKTSSARFEYKCSGYQVDDTRIVGRAATQMFTTEDIKPRGRCPDLQERKDVNEIASAQHVKEVLLENFLALRAANQPRFADKRCVRSIACDQGGGYDREFHRSGDFRSAYNKKDHTQELAGNHSRTHHRRAVSADVGNATESATQSSLNRNSEMKHRCGSVGSSVGCGDIHSSDKTVQKAMPQTRSSSKPPVKENTSNVPAKNTLEYLLFGLSPEEMAPTDYSDISGRDNDTESNASSNISTQHHGSAASTSEPQSLELVPVSSSGSRDSSHAVARTTDGDKLTVATPQILPDLLGDEELPPPKDYRGQQNQNDPWHFDHSVSLDACNSSAAPQTSHFIEATYQPTTVSPATRALVPYEYSTALPSQPSPVEMRPTAPSSQPSPTEIQPVSEDTKTGRRNELPADLFVSPYHLNTMPMPMSMSTSTSGWQTGSNYGMGFNMHYYPPQMPISPFPNVVKSTNPFDTNDNTTQPQVNLGQFGSQGLLQGGLTNGFNPHTSSYGSYLPGSPAYPSNTHHQLPYASPAGAYYMNQHSFHNMSSASMQGGGGDVGLHPNQPIPYRYPTPSDQNPFPTGGGNPFG